MWVNETFIPRWESSPFRPLRFASRVSTAIVRKEVAVGIDRLSSIALASIPAGPRRTFSSAAGAVSPSAAASTSALVTLPPDPLPRIWSRVSPSAAATRRATGVERPSPGSMSPLPELPDGSDSVMPASASGALPFDAPEDPPAASEGSISTSGDPTSTSSSISAQSLVIRPAVGAGTSASTLSVETSTMVWPSSTTSPTAT